MKKKTLVSFLSLGLVAIPFASYMLPTAVGRRGDADFLYKNEKAEILNEKDEILKNLRNLPLSKKKSRQKIKKFEAHEDDFAGTILEGGKNLGHVQNTTPFDSDEAIASDEPIASSSLGESLPTVPTQEITSTLLKDVPKKDVPIQLDLPKKPSRRKLSRRTASKNIPVKNRLLSDAHEDPGRRVNDAEDDLGGDENYRAALPLGDKDLKEQVNKDPHQALDGPNVLAAAEKEINQVLATPVTKEEESWAKRWLPSWAYDAVSYVADIPERAKKKLMSKWDGLSPNTQKLIKYGAIGIAAVGAGYVIYRVGKHKTALPGEDTSSSALPGKDTPNEPPEKQKHGNLRRRKIDPVEKSSREAGFWGDTGKVRKVHLEQIKGFDEAAMIISDKYINDQYKCLREGRTCVSGFSPLDHIYEKLSGNVPFMCSPMRVLCHRAGKPTLPFYLTARHKEGNEATPAGICLADPYQKAALIANLGCNASGLEGVNTGLPLGFQAIRNGVMWLSDMAGNLYGAEHLARNLGVGGWWDKGKSFIVGNLANFASPALGELVGGLIGSIVPIPGATTTGQSIGAAAGGFVGYYAAPFIADGAQFAALKGPTWIDALLKMSAAAN